MRKIAFIISLLCALPSFAASMKDVKEATYYGIDYSHVKVSSTETAEEFINVFGSINDLILQEQKKYVDQLAQTLKIKITDVDLAKQKEVIKAINTDSLMVSRVKVESSESYLGSILNNIESKGNTYGILLVAKAYDKAANSGYYDLVVFNAQTKEVIATQALEGKAGGFGLRNYWAKTAFTAAKSINVKKLKK
ncbi:MAG: hypothetical protein MJZ23_03615 [Paludibacteraceae bacterium]|nr:hypothetical protein [Paludibacteraceae bacterium]